MVCEIKQMDSSGSVCSWAAKCAATDDRPAESDRSVFVITKPAVGDACGAQSVIYLFIDRFIQFVFLFYLYVFLFFVFIHSLYLLNFFILYFNF